MKALALGLLVFATTAASASEPGPWRRLWGWGPDPARDKYEELFDAEYPRRSYDPFNRSFPFEDVRNFNRQFDLRAAGVSQTVKEEGTSVTLSVLWPGSGAQGLEVLVQEGAVRLTPEGADEPAGRFRFRARGASQLFVPVPLGARSATARISRSGDEVRVVFDR